MRIAVISPFLDRSHGTERCIIEQLERTPPDQKAEVHIYSQRVQDLTGLKPYRHGEVAESAAQLLWHRVPSIGGPHLLRYIFWVLATNLLRRWDHTFRHLNFDIVYSPGINAASADAIAVHIVFHEFYRQVRPQLSFRKTPVSGWPRLLHRRLYYRLIMALETRIYRRPEISLAAVSTLVAGQLGEYFQRENVRVIRNGVDVEKLSALRRLERRESARKQFGLAADDFAFLLIGNDWKKKGLDALLSALAELRDLRWKLLVVGSDTRDAYQKFVADRGIVNRVSFLAPSPDVLQFYAAADAYAGPSLEDAYGLPILEAMACGLPVVSSSRAGASEIIRDGVSGIILRNPENASEIAGVLRALISDPDCCSRLGEEASRAARDQTWERNAQATWKWLDEVFQEKRSQALERKLHVENGAARP